MGARYWRAVGLETYGGEQLRLWAVHWYNGATRVDGAASVSATIAPVAGAVANLQGSDTLAVTQWPRAAFGAPGFALVWDFGAPVDVTGLRFGAADQAAYPSVVHIERSDDGQVWSSAGNGSGLIFPGAGVLSALPPAADTSMGPARDGSDAVYMRFEGADGSTTIADDAGHAFTAYGGAQLRAADAIDGSTSLYCNGSTAYIAAPASAAFNLGTGAFTVRASIRPFGLSHMVVLGRTSGTYYINREWSVQMLSATQMRFYYGVRGSNHTLLDFTVPFTLVVGHAYAVLMGRDDEGFWRCFVNGQKCSISWGSDKTNLDDSSASMPLTIGAFVAGGIYAPFHGMIDSVRVRPGESPPMEWVDAAAQGPGFDGQPLPLHGRPAGLDLQPLVRQDIAGAVAAAPGPALLLARDLQHGGLGTIYGTTKTKGTPNLPTRARVLLLDQRSKLLVRETWSDPATGAFAFTDIDVNQQFLTLAEDVAGNFRPVAASRLTPEVLP